MPTYTMTLRVHTEADNPADAATEFLAGTEDADVSFDIVKTEEVEPSK